MITTENFQAMWAGTKFWSVGTVDTEFHPNDFQPQELIFGTFIPGPVNYVEVMKYSPPPFRTYPMPTYYIPENFFFRCYTTQPGEYEILQTKLEILNQFNLTPHEYGQKLSHDYGYYMSAGPEISSSFKDWTVTMERKFRVYPEGILAEPVLFKGIVQSTLDFYNPWVNFKLVELPVGI